MRLTTILCGLLLVARLPGFGQTPAYREHYRALVQQHKSPEATAVVLEWEKTQPQDPDVYVAKFNVLLRAAERPLRAGGPATTGYVRGTGNGITVGDELTDYEPAQVQEAIRVLRKGLALAPDRLDIHFGMAKACEDIGDAAQQYQILSEALAWRQSAQGRPWRWQDGAALPEPEAQFVPAAVEEYIGPYWSSAAADEPTPGTGVPLKIGPDNATHQTSYQRGLALAELLVKYYPQSSLGYFNRALYYGLAHDEPQALTEFAQADQRQPNDPETLANLTRLSLQLKHKAAAQGYLARLRKYPDFKADCQQFAAELKKL